MEATADHLRDMLWARGILSLVALTVAAVLYARSPGQTELVLLCAAGFLVASSVLFSLMVRRGKTRQTCIALIVTDTVLISLATVFTGGVVSAVAVFYLWPIVLASLMFAPWVSFLVAATVCLLYAGLWLSEARGTLALDTTVGAGELPDEWTVTVVGIRLGAFMLISLLTTLAAAATTGENARLRRVSREATAQLADTRMINRRLRALSDPECVFHRHPDVASMLPEALTEIVSVIDADAAFARVRDKTQDDGLATATVGDLRATTVRELQEAGIYELCRQKSFAVCDSAEDGVSAAVLEAIRRAGYRRIAIGRLQTKSGRVGFICLLLGREPVDRERLEAAESLCAQLALAIDTIQHTDELRRVNAELRRANEELTHLDKLKSDFMATMSHELRTPLTSIIGYSDMLLSGMGGTLDEKQHSFVTSILNNGEALLNLINDILDLTKIEAGRLELKLEPVDLRAALLGVLPVIKPRAAEKRIKVSTFLPTDLPRVIADSNKLTQILLNLLTNAIKYTNENGSVSVEARRRNGMAEIWVTDTGVGIATADQEKIFQRFTQIDSSATRSQGGTGLGLAITRELVELHGGRIRVQSKPGSGSSFIFTMPIWTAASATAQTAAS